MASVELGYTEYTDFGFACDESGCVLAVQQQDSKHAQSTPSLTSLLSGADWSLGMLPVTTPSQTRFEAFLPTSSSETVDYQLASSSSAASFSCVASGPGWQVALEPAELSELVHMLVQLRMAVASLQYQGLWQAGKGERPPSRAKWESKGLGLTAVYCPGEPGFSVELRFSAQGRGMRLSWPPKVAADVITAFDDEMGLRPLAARGT